MGDHEHVDAGERYFIERTADGRDDLEIPARELGGRSRVPERVRRSNAGSITPA